MGRDLRYENAEDSSSGISEFIHLLHSVTKCTFCLPWLNESGETLPPERLPESGEAAEPSGSADGEVVDLPLVFLRFENQTDASVSAYWVDEKGEDKFYFDLHSGCSITHASYVTNVWEVKDKATDTRVVSYKADDRLRQWCPIPFPALPHPPNATSASASASAAPLAPLDDVSIPPCYTKRVTTRSRIPAVGYSQVSTEALQMAAEVVDSMLEGCSPSLVARLVDARCKVAVIAKDQVTTDILEHSHLKGSLVGDGRSWDTGVRGLGGTIIIPTCSVGEENVLRRPQGEDKFALQSILVHEFAHTVMEVGFGKMETQRIKGIFEKNKTKYTPGIYMVVDEKEYWAEATASWFNASIRTEVNDGVNTREKLRAHDIEVSELLQEVWGDGSWRYDFDRRSPLPRPKPVSGSDLYLNTRCAVS